MTYEIMASEIGFEFEKDVRIKINREPQTDAEWQFVSQFVEETFPLTSDEISHGFSQTSCNVVLPEPGEDEDEVPSFDSLAGNLNIYVPVGYKSKAEYLAESLNLRDNRNNPSISKLFRYFIDNALADTHMTSA